MNCYLDHTNLKQKATNGNRMFKHFLIFSFHLIMKVKDRNIWRWQIIQLRKSSTENLLSFPSSTFSYIYIYIYIYVCIRLISKCVCVCVCVCVWWESFELILRYIICFLCFYLSLALTISPALIHAYFHINFYLSESIYILVYLLTYVTHPTHIDR